MLAHVDREEGPRVDVAAVDSLAGAHLVGGRGGRLCRDRRYRIAATPQRPIRPGTRRPLESSVPVLAAVTRDATDGFLGGVTNRSDATRFVVESGTVDALPNRLATWARVRC